MRKQVLPAVLLGVGDALCGTLIFTRGVQWERIVNLRTGLGRVEVADLWLTCLLRFALLLCSASLLTSTRWRHAYVLDTPEHEVLEQRTSSGDSCWWRCIPRGRHEKSVARHYRPKSKEKSHAGAEQEATLQFALMIVTLFLVTGALVKISFLACFADEISEGLAWRWCSAAQAVLFTLADFFLLKWVISQSTEHHTNAADRWESVGEDGGGLDSATMPLLSELGGSEGSQGMKGFASTASLKSTGSGSSRCETLDSTDNSQRQTEAGGSGRGSEKEDRKKKKGHGMSRLCGMALNEWPYLLAAVVFLLLAAGSSCMQV